MKTSGLHSLEKALTNPFLQKIWLLLLIFVNLGGGVAFIDKMAGKSAIVSFIGAIIVMLIIYLRAGYIRLLWLGPMLFWIPMQIEFLLIVLNGNPQAMFYTWLITVLIVNGISLFIGIVNVLRFMLGNTQPINRK
jgi:hypothetical protein